MPDSLNTFLRRGGRLTAFDLACAENPEAWNTWRQQSDMFGDHANLRIDLSRLNLGGRNLTGYNLVNVSFQRSGLNGTILRSVDCAYSDFYEANLIGADLSRANLKNAKLGRAFLRDANFSRADLRGADLRRASLTSASLLGANICGVDLSNSRGLEQQQLEDAIGDRRTRIPQHLQMPAAWAIYDAEPPPETGELGKLVILPASVEIAVISGRVQLSSSPGTAFFASSADPEILLAEIIEDLNRVKVRCSNSGELSHAIEKYLNESEKKNYDVILLGVRGIKIQEIFGVMV
jgi:hypothetical protein